MLNRIIRIAAVVCTLCLAGCIHRLDPVETDGEIRFTAGSALLRDDATKSGTLKPGPTFEEGDYIHVWSWHHAVSQHLSFGTTTPVTVDDNNVWDYEPHMFWNWQGGDDYYNFLGVYCGTLPVTNPTNSLQATVIYNALDSQVDIMAAGYHRDDGSITPVPLTFNHMLSAVSVQVKNSLGSVDKDNQEQSIILKSCRFVNLITRSAITFSYNGAVVSNSPGAENRTATAALGPTIPANTTLDPGDSYPTTTVWDLMVPQNLDTESNNIVPPSLEIVFNTGEGDDITKTLDLKDITSTSDGNPITAWRAGIKYQYLIELRLGVGISVTVQTTPWKVIEAQTPGLMI